jgi:hypothetical protein
MYTYKVGDRVMWLTSFAMAANVLVGDLGTVVELGKVAGEYFIRPDTLRGSLPRGFPGWLAREKSLVRVSLVQAAFVQAGISPPLQLEDILPDRDNRQAVSVSKECPCGISRAICDYHRSI